MAYHADGSHSAPERWQGRVEGPHVHRIEIGRALSATFAFKTVFVCKEFAAFDGDFGWLGRLPIYNQGSGRRPLVTRRGGFWRLLAIAWSACGGAVCFGQALAPTQIGCNLERIRDWSRSGTFVDVIKQSRGFAKAGTGLSTPAALDTQGWPTEDFDVILMTDIAEVQGLTGTYKVSGLSNQLPTILAVASGVTVSNVQHNAATRQFTADVTLDSSALGLILSFRSTGGGAQALRVLRPGYDTANPPRFTTPFLAHVARFSTLRYMEWTQANGHPVSHWSDRTPAASPSYFVDSGVPWEVCIELANLTQRDMWINVPHMADDEYVQSLATLIRDTLSPNLRVYVEHSNEVWNGMFAQCGYNLGQALSRAEELDLYYDGPTGDTIVNARYHAYRTKQIGDVFGSVFGPGSLNSRVRVVLAGQQVEPSLLYSGLDYLNREFGHPSNYLFALATAPYFNMGASQYIDGLTPSQVIAALREHVNTLDHDERLEQNARMARWFGLPMLAYEGGSDTAGGTSLEAKRLALMDPRMFDLCTDYLRTWFAWGFGELQWFTGGASSWRAASGSWGLTEDMSIQNTFRILAIDAVIDQQALPVNKGHAIPGYIDARRHVDRPPNWSTISEALDDLALGQEVDYVINAPYDASLRVRFGMGCGNPGHLLGVAVNGAQLGTIDVPVTGGIHVYGNSEVIAVPFTAGLNVIRLRALSQGSYSILNVQVLCPVDLDDDGSVANGLNPDGGVDINDLLAFIDLFANGDVLGDLDDDGVLPPDPDNAVDINDLLFFLVQFEAGC
jgi:hypothetical protein